MSELLSRGTIVAETWEVDEPLGRGGMGEVWRARHRRVEGKLAAIKVLHATGEEADAFVARFKREAEIAARLEHPNIVQVFDYDTLPTGEPYIVMELLRGESLKERLKRGPMPMAELQPLVAQLCSALHVAHARGVVHRDLKPDNLFLVPTPTGPQLKVLDFGISKLVGSHTVQTSEDVLIGTPLYMSPEQALGDNAALTSRSDLFTTASICYEALSGQAPFRADSVAKIIYRILHVDPPDLPGVEAAAMSALRRALVKEPAQRTPDIATFAREFCGVTLGDLAVPDAARAPAPADGADQTRGSRGAKAVAGPLATPAKLDDVTRETRPLKNPAPPQDPTGVLAPRPAESSVAAATPDLPPSGTSHTPTPGLAAAGVDAPAATTPPATTPPATTPPATTPPATTPPATTPPATTPPATTPSAADLAERQASTSASVPRPEASPRQKGPARFVVLGALATLAVVGAVLALRTTSPAPKPTGAAGATARPPADDLSGVAANPTDGPRAAAQAAAVDAGLGVASSPVVDAGATVATSAVLGPGPGVAPSPLLDAGSVVATSALVDAGPAVAASPVLDAGAPGQGAAKHVGAPHVAPVKEEPLDALSQSLLGDAQQAFETERFLEVLALTQKPALATSSRAAVLRMMSACALGNLGLVNATKPRVPAGQLGAVRKYCKGRGVEVP